MPMDHHEGGVVLSRNFLADAFEVASRRVALGTLPRRDFLKIASLAAAAGLVGTRAAQAQAKEIVFANWGGDSEIVYGEAWGVPFEEATGIPVVFDGEGPTAGRIRSMVTNNSVTWDLCDGGVDAGNLAAHGFLEPVDYTIVDKNKVLDGFRYDWGLTGYMFSSVIAYNKAKFGDAPPQTWADFWDVKKFPGKRTMYKYMDGTLESMLLADGVKPEDVYPIDLERALAKLAELREHIIFWDTGSSSQQLLRDEEVVMGQIWNTRAHLVRDETGGAIDYHWNNAILQPGVWSVPKGNPAGKDVWRFLAFMQDPESQIEVLKGLGNAPANPEAAKFYTPELEARSATAPANLATQFVVKPDWYIDNHAEAAKRYLEVISG